MPNHASEKKSDYKRAETEFDVSGANQVQVYVAIRGVGDDDDIDLCLLCP
jgi:hypothetical protein